MTTLSLSTDYGLGTLLSEHHISSKRSKGNMISGIIIAIGSIIVLLIGIWMAVSQTYGAGVCSGIGLLALLFGTWTIWTYQKEKNVFISLYQDGLVYGRQNKTEVARWDEINRVNMHIHYSRKLRTSTYIYNLHLNAGGTVSLNYTDGAMENMKQLSDTIQQKTTQQLLPKAVAEFNAGLPVTFGPITVDKEGVYRGKKFVPWYDVEDIQIRNGVINVLQHGKWVRWATIPVAKVSNLFVFLNLVYHILGKSK